MQLRQLQKGCQASATSNVAVLQHLDVSVAYVKARVHRLLFNLALRE